jgi:uncharacterized protein YwgA
MGKGEVKWLIQRLGISPKKLTGASSLKKRLRIQKAAFLLRHLGVSPFNEYDFNLYLHGPYSSNLAANYSHLEKVRTRPVKLDSEKMKLLEWFVSNEDRWLEVASSIIWIKNRSSNTKKEDTYSVLMLSKPWIDNGLFKSVVTDLEEQGL